MKAFLKHLMAETGFVPVLGWGVIWLFFVTWAVIQDPNDPIAPWGYALYALVLIIIIGYEALTWKKRASR